MFQYQNWEYRLDEPFSSHDYEPAHEDAWWRIEEAAYPIENSARLVELSPQVDAEDARRMVSLRADSLGVVRLVISPDRWWADEIHVELTDGRTYVWMSGCECILADFVGALIERLLRTASRLLLEQMLAIQCIQPVER